MTHLREHAELTKEARREGLKVEVVEFRHCDDAEAFRVVCDLFEIGPDQVDSETQQVLAFLRSADAVVLELVPIPAGELETPRPVKKLAPDRYECGESWPESVYYKPRR